MAALLSVSGHSVEPGDGFFSASTMSWAEAATRSLVVGIGTVMWSPGNHETVSVMRTASVSQVTVLKQR